MKLELGRPLEGKPKSFYTPSHLLPLEKETIDELLSIDFIEPYIEEIAASTLLVPKKGPHDRRFYCNGLGPVSWDPVKRGSTGPSHAEPRCRTWTMRRARAPQQLSTESP